MNVDHQDKWQGQAGALLAQSLNDAWPFQYEIETHAFLMGDVGYISVHATNPPNLVDVGNHIGEQYPHPLNIAITWQEEDVIHYLDSPPEVQIHMLAGVRRQFENDMRQLAHAEAFFPAGRQKQNRPFVIQLDNFDQ